MFKRDDTDFKCPTSELKLSRSGSKRFDSKVEKDDFGSKRFDPGVQTGNLRHERFDIKVEIIQPGR
jgi:hypothetical protein